MYVDHARPRPAASDLATASAPAGLHTVAQADALTAPAAPVTVGHQEAVERHIDPVMPGFITWLAERELPPGRRRRYHLAVERFLCWHTGHRHWPTRHHPVSPAGPGLSGQDLIGHDFEYCLPSYLSALRGAGHGLIELRVVETGINHLRRYLTRGPDHRTQPGGRS
jgi:hypothetical protein